MPLSDSHIINAQEPGRVHDLLEAQAAEIARLRAALLACERARSPDRFSCARCGQELNNVAPGYSVVRGGALVCAACLRPGEEVARARSIE